MRKNVPTKFERDRDRGKGLARVDKNCMLNEWDFVEEEEEGGRRGRGIGIQKGNNNKALSP